MKIRDFFFANYGLISSIKSVIFDNKFEKVLNFTFIFKYYNGIKYSRLKDSDLKKIPPVALFVMRKPYRYVPSKKRKEMYAKLSKKHIFL